MMQSVCGTPMYMGMGCRCTCLSICLVVHLPIHLPSLSPFVHPSIHEFHPKMSANWVLIPSVYLFINPLIHQSIHQSIHPSWCIVSAHTHVHGYGFPYCTRSSICLAIHLTIHLSTCPSIHLSVSLSTHLYFLYDAKGLQLTALKGVRVRGFISSLHLSIHLSIHPSTQSPYLSHWYTSCR